MPLTTSKQSETRFRAIWKNIEHQERIYVIFTNSEGVQLNYKRIDKGKFNTCDVDFPLIVQTALNKRYHFIILAHNHTMGDPTPSQFDLRVTEHLIKILSALDITLVDHIILTKDSYYSFEDAGLIPKIKKAC